MRTKKKSKKAGSLNRAIPDHITVSSPYFSIEEILELIENELIEQERIEREREQEREQREREQREQEFLSNLTTEEAIKFFSEDEDEDETDRKIQRTCGNKKRKKKTTRRRGRK